MISEDLDFTTESESFSPEWLDSESWDIEPAECWGLDEFRDELRLDGTLRPDTWH